MFTLFFLDLENIGLATNLYVKCLQMNIVSNLTHPQICWWPSMLMLNKSIVKVDSAVHLGHRMGKDFNVKIISRGVSNLIDRDDLNEIQTQLFMCARIS